MLKTAASAAADNSPMGSHYALRSLLLPIFLAGALNPLVPVRHFRKLLQRKSLLWLALIDPAIPA